MPATCSAYGDISVIPYCSNLRCPVSPIIKNNPIVSNESLVLRMVRGWDEDLEKQLQKTLREVSWMVSPWWVCIIIIFVLLLFGFWMEKLWRFRHSFKYWLIVRLHIELFPSVSPKYLPTACSFRISLDLSTSLFPKLNISFLRYLILRDRLFF